MTAKLKSLKTELKRLADVGELKKELNRLAAEIRGFDFASALSPERRLIVEKRYTALRETLTDLQKRVDTSFTKFAALVRKNRGVVKKTSRKARPAAPKTTAKKAAAKKSTPATKKKASKRSN